MTIYKRILPFFDAVFRPTPVPSRNKLENVRVERLWFGLLNCVLFALPLVSQHPVEGIERRILDDVSTRSA